MPMYEFLNDETGEKITRYFKLDNRDDVVFENGMEYKYCMSSPRIVSGVGGLKVPGNLKDRLAQIKKQNPEMRSSVV